MTYARVVPALLVMGLLGGCNCEGNSSLCTFLSPPTTGTSASAAGIWTGTDSISGLEMTGLVNSDGQAVFIRSDGVEFVGTVQVTGTSLEIALDGYTQFGYEFSDGSTFGIGTFSGTFDGGSSISGSLDFTTADNTVITSNWSLTFDSLYDTASSLATIGGTYTDSLAAVSDGLDPLSGSSVTISSSGTLYAQGSTDGCVANGTVTVENASDDLYDVSYSYSNCSGSYAVLNSVEFTGMAELNRNESPAQIILAVSGESSTGGYYGIVSELTGS